MAPFSGGSVTSSNKFMHISKAKMLSSQDISNLFSYVILRFLNRFQRNVANYLKSAFRLLPVSVLDFDQLGFKFDGKFYFDKAMPFGCNTACQSWKLYSTFLEFCVTMQSSVGKLLHYLDDFLFGGKKGTNDCACIMSVFQGE